MSKEINLEGYRLAHTMIRVKDLEASFNFYCKTLGMKILRKTDYPDGKFTNAFIGYGLETESPCLELTLVIGIKKKTMTKEMDGDMFVLKHLMFTKLVKILKTRCEYHSKTRSNETWN